MIILKFFCFLVFLFSFFGCQSSINVVKSDLNAVRDQTELASIDLDVPANGISNGNFSWEKAGKAYEICVADEHAFQRIKSTVLDDIEVSLEELNIRRLDNLLTKRFSFINSLKKTESRVNRLHEITISNMAFNAIEKNETVFDYIKKSFSLIDDAAIDTFSVKNLGDSLPLKSRARLFTNIDIRGKDSENLRSQLRAQLVFEVIFDDEQNRWLVESLELLDLSLLKTKASVFTKVNIENLVPSYLRREAIRRGGYAVSVVDYNNDGINDIYVGTSRKGVFLRGKKSGGFEPDEDTGVIDDEKVKTAMFYDFDNDGDQDLVIVKYDTGIKKHDILVFENNGLGRYKKIPNFVNQIDFSGFAMPAAVGDFNNDSLLDFYVGFPGKKDFTFINQPTAIAAVANKSIKAHGVFYNSEKLNFKESKGDYIFDRNKYYEHVFPHSSLAVDFDEDGDTDIVVIDDRNNLSPILVNNGDGTFQNSATKIGLTNQGFGMGVSAGDFNNDGFIDFLLTNVDFTAAHRMRASCTSNHDIEILPNFDSGLRLFQGTGSGKFVEVTDISGLRWAGEGSAGVEFVDYDNDGYLDIYVTNGVWSGTNKNQDLSSHFVRSINRLKDFDRLSLDQHSTRSRYMRILMNYAGDVYDKNSDLNERPSLAGYQRNRLFHNNGNGTFTEIGYLLGVDSIADGYVVAKADLNRDGRIDFILRNADQGTNEYSFAPLEIYMNDFKDNNSITIKLIGQKSNADAVGSKVVAQIKNRKVKRYLLGNNGSAQSQKLIHIGLGNNKKADQLSVIWPSGEISKFSNVPSGNYQIREGTNILGARIGLSDHALNAQ